VGSETTVVTRETKSLSGLGVAVVAVGLLGWGAVLVAARQIPSPARETVFVDTAGRSLARRMHCHGTVFLDDLDVWMNCTDVDSTETARPFLTRFDTRTGRATWMGAYPEYVPGLHGGIVGPAGSRVFLSGNTMVEVHDGRVRGFHTVLQPLGMATVGDGVEVLAGGSRDVRVERFEGGRPVGSRVLTLGIVPTDGVQARAMRGYHDGTAWHVLVATHPATVPALPLPVVLHDHTERGDRREVTRMQLGPDQVMRLASGETSLLPGGVFAGNVVSGWLGIREARIVRAEGVTVVRFPDASPLDVAAAFLSAGPHTRVSFTDVRERRVWTDGTVLTRFVRNGRFVALETGGHRGPALVSRFWMDGGFRVVPHADGSATLLGALGGSYIQVGRDLARTDGLSLPERFLRLFVPDRAKRNADLHRPLGLAGFAIIPFVLLGPLLGAWVLRHRGHPGLRRWLAWTWIVLTLAGAYPFVRYLRFYF